MNLSIVSFDGTAINDGTNYEAYFPVGSVMLQAEGQVVLTNRDHFSPVFSSKIRSAKSLPIHIIMKGTISSQITTIHTLFDTSGNTLKKLLVKDTADTDRQWYVMATPISTPDVNGQEVIINLSVPDPIWVTETEASTVWEITASGQTQAITNSGALDAYPVYSIKPTSAKSSGYTRKQVFATVYNQSTHTISDDFIDLGENAWDTAALIADTTRSVTINDGDGITDADVTITYDGEVGTFPTSGEAYLGTEQISYTGKSATELTGCTRGINGTSAAAHADDVVIYASKMAADGSDIHVFVDGEEVDYWLDDINTNNTSLWINIDLVSQIALTVEGAYDADDTAIAVEDSYANRLAIARLPNTGILLWESELVTFSAKDTTGLTITLCGRGAKESTADSHADATTLYYVDHDIWIVYGDTYLADYTVDDTRKPIINLTTSTMASFDWDDFLVHNFNDTAEPRSGSWGYVVGPSNADSSAYYVSMATTTPPNQGGTEGQTFSVLGLRHYKAPQTSTPYFVISAFSTASLYVPYGATHVAADGRVYRSVNQNGWSCVFQKSSDGITWTTVWSESAPSATVQTAWSHASTDLSGTYYYFRFVFSAEAQWGTSNGDWWFEVDNFTLTVNSSGIPYIALGSEQTPYLLTSTLKNNTTSEQMLINYAIPLDHTLEIDTDAYKVTFIEEGVPARSAISVPLSRWDWLRLAAGSNTLLYTETGATGVTVTVELRYRKSA